ncbi:coiled-coil domain-containing protein 142 [Nasonia vitripennis]|uniref:Coiled-coil protein 142 C-terminal domain-containing protein n=1 Tax=Nasonia vitripennis TaxID=7425 RepID=A0A7M7QEX8_NASVI|nr:coiled-coil domain-containing protein 142 [Nasonia vitripennis]
MDSNYRANVGKWLPRVAANLEKYFADSSALNETMGRLARRIAALLKNASRSDSYDQTELKSLIKELESVIPEYRMMSEVVETQNLIFKYKIEHLTTSLKRSVNIVARCTRLLINEICSCTNHEYLRMIFRLVNVYNDLLSLDHDVSEPSVNIFYNDCPNMLEPLKIISVSRILQIIANKRAEEYCHELIDCLLANYRSSCDKDDSRFMASNDIEVAENSSIEIYRTLTKHLTPPITAATGAREAVSNIESMQALVNTQNEQVVRLLNVVKIISPQLLGSDATRIENDELKIRRTAVKKVTEFYQEVAWGSVSSILDHVVLWWSREALAARHSHGSQHLKDWLHQFIQGSEVPSTVRPALQTLCDALGCHVTITAWDQLFRLAYTAAFECQSKAPPEIAESSRECITKGTDTGQKFAELFELLMTLSNACETGGEWVIGAPLVELPLSEQIVVLHRMDHSVHTMRLWAMQEARMIAHTWELEVFFLIVKGDIVNCLEILSYLKLADHSNELESEPVSVQVYVCAKMRAKIVSEVTANIQLLKEAPALCTKILAQIGRVVSLANLHMCFPKSSYWRRNLSVAPNAPSLYVESYFERVLLPILEVINDPETSNMVLRIMCEAWLDYIYLHKIKFSEWGALQLLKDFAHVLTWVTECGIISEKVRQHLLKNEVLRRCEGVGRLLLRHPGEAISMNKKLPQRTSDNGSPESLGLERMPAEMYVPNQEQWLELRASKGLSFCCMD